MIKQDMVKQHYDLIGDIHGHADELQVLLQAMGYRLIGGCYRHESRKVIYLGDFIDRGPKQREVLQIVMPMVESGGALSVMGNHEFNALAFHTPDPDNPAKHLRPRTEKNLKQHRAFLQAYGDKRSDPELARVLKFFWKLPLWLDLPGIRVVHACWHPYYMASIRPLLGPGNTLTEKLLLAASRKRSSYYRAVEVILKGLEYHLPEGHGFQDKDDHWRTSVRTKWWNSGKQALHKITFDPIKELADHQLDDSLLPGYGTDEKPVFIGHYWLRSSPSLLSDNVACLDYSVAKGGRLVAYRWRGEQLLCPSNFFFVKG